MVLIRAPYRVTFAYAGPDRVWRPVWRGEGELPAAIRVQLRDAATDRTLSVSTATLVHANMPADCVFAEVIADCLNRPDPGVPATSRGARDDEPRLARLLRPRSGRDGFIVVAVLWILAALATLVTIFSMYVINTATAFTVHDERLQAEGLARAAIELSVYQAAAAPEARRRAELSCSGSAMRW